MSRLRGRFDRPADAEMGAFASSLEVDLRMAREDIRGSIAHVGMLGETGILSAVESAALRDALERVGEELAEGGFVPGDADEDIHMAVERRLVEIAGDVGEKLHTARSRNDQVATDVRLWLKTRLGETDRAIRELLGALLDRVEADGRTLMPGYTHGQRGQPILLGHHLLAHAWALHRDRGRLADAFVRLDECPLGACAMAGTPHPVDRGRVAELLGFARVMENAMDAVAARDHQQEVAAVCAICLTHLSRMAEELVLWSGAEFGFVSLSESYATGSSIMPQKRNPDAAELVRGKAARVIGDLVTLLVLVKGLPMAYNRDLQEDRRPLFDAVETTTASCRIMAGVWRSLEIDTERWEEELVGDFSLATELADALAANGVPFREAHEAIGALVLRLDRENRDLSALGPEELGTVHPGMPEHAERLLDPREAAERRVSRGGTAWTEIERQVALLRPMVASVEPFGGEECRGEECRGEES